MFFSSFIRLVVDIIFIVFNKSNMFVVVKKEIGLTCDLHYFTISFFMLTNTETQIVLITNHFIYYEGLFSQDGGSK